MRSGVPDYDTVASRAWQLAHPTTDIDPLTILRQFVKPGFSCPPGTCGEYSSTNFVLLGMVLAGLKGRAVRRWEDLNQTAILPPAALALLKHSSFPQHGACGKVKGMVHALVPTGTGRPADAFDVSCTNGWTCGNWAGATVDDSLCHTTGYQPKPGGCHAGAMGAGRAATGRSVRRDAADGAARHWRFWGGVTLWPRHDGPGLAARVAEHTAVRHVLRPRGGHVWFYGHLWLHPQD
mmetsp:Transcript_27482/g.82175  ORF Transcript_27482/g.82175 Transcript_27482/m.82175 type:complete len:236 (-) Transcript_27482:134-841(-)